MNRFGNDWWPAGVAHPRLRLLAALAASPLILAALATGLGYVVGGMTLPGRDEVTAQTVTVGLTALGALLAFSGSFGLIAVLILWVARRRSALAFALAGAMAGALFAVFTILVMTELVLTPPIVAIMAVIGALALVLVRWIAGVRSLPAQ
jgi:hypothetical protein